MKAVSVCLVFGTICFLLVSVRADCGDPPKEGEEGGVKNWFSNIGCKIQKGAEDLGESAKPWAEKVGASAKDFGNTVAQKYDAIKHKLTDETVDSSTIAKPVVHEPTEKVPLAPLSGASVDSQSAQSNFPDKTTTLFPSNLATPSSIDDRFIFQPYECPSGQAKDNKNRCRPII